MRKSIKKIENKEIITQLQNHELFKGYLNEEWTAFLNGAISKANQYKDKEVKAKCLANAASFDDEYSNNNKGESLVFIDCCLNVEGLEYPQKKKLLETALKSKQSSKVDCVLDKCLSGTAAEDIAGYLNIIEGYQETDPETSKEFGKQYIARIYHGEIEKRLINDYLWTFAGLNWWRKIKKYKEKNGIK